MCVWVLVPCAASGQPWDSLNLLHWGHARTGVMPVADPAQPPTGSPALMETAAECSWGSTGLFLHQPVQAAARLTTSWGHLAHLDGMTGGKAKDWTLRGAPGCAPYIEKTLWRSHDGLSFKNTHQPLQTAELQSAVRGPPARGGCLVLASC